MISARVRLSWALAFGLLLAALSPSHALFDKTRFAAHLGAAYFAFHHWVLAPYTQGKFTAGAPGRAGGLVKGGLAMLFAVHEVKVAEKIARTSHDPLLQKLDGGLMNLQNTFAHAGQNLKSGTFKAADIDQLSRDTNTFGSAAAAAGQPIRDLPVTVPGL